MSLLNNALHIKFFNNKEFNYFYWAIFIITIGESMINIFVPIYLYLLGFKIYQVLFFYFLISFFCLLFSYSGAKIVSKIGEKHSILLSTPFIILYYIGLIYIESNNLLFFILPALISLRATFFNYGYHLNFINHSEGNKRGQELAFVGIITVVATVIAPYIGGLLADINFAIVFTISSILMLVGTAPLFLSEDKCEKLDFTFVGLFKNIFSKNNKGCFISFSGYAIESIIGRTIWPIFLITIVITLSKAGILISLTMLLSLITFYFVGKITDKISKVKLLKFGTLLYFFSWVGRIFADTSYKIFFIDSYKNLSEKILQLPWSAHSYDLAKRTNHFEFIVSREIIFHIIRILVLPVLMFIFWIDFYPFIISFLTASVFSLGYIFIDE